MLSISEAKTSTGAANYYLELAQGDYYTNAHAEPGRWFGPAAALLGLDGEASASAFNNLLEGRSAVSEDNARAWVDQHLK